MLHVNLSLLLATVVAGGSEGSFTVAPGFVVAPVKPKVKVDKLANAIKKAKKKNKPLVIYVAQPTRKIKGCNTFNAKTHWNLLTFEPDATPRVIVYWYPPGSDYTQTTVMPGKPSRASIRKVAFPPDKRKRVVRVAAAPVRMMPMGGGGGGGC